MSNTRSSASEIEFYFQIKIVSSQIHRAKHTHKELLLSTCFWFRTPFEIVLTWAKWSTQVDSSFQEPNLASRLVLARVAPRSSEWVSEWVDWCAWGAPILAPFAKLLLLLVLFLLVLRVLTWSGRRRRRFRRSVWLYSLGSFVWYRLLFSSFESSSSGSASAVGAFWNGERERERVRAKKMLIAPPLPSSAESGQIILAHRIGVGNRAPHEWSRVGFAEKCTRICLGVVDTGFLKTWMHFRKLRDFGAT